MKCAILGIGHQNVIQVCEDRVLCCDNWHMSNDI